LAGGSEGWSPPIPQPTLRKDLPNSLDRDNEWKPGSKHPEIEKKGRMANPV